MRSSYWYAVNVRRLALAALCLSLSGAQAEAQKRRSESKATVTAESTVMPACHAALDDPQGFKTALLKRDVELRGFRTKLKTGYYVVSGQMSSELALKTPQDLISKTSNALADIAEAKTALLIYDISHRPGKRDLLCVWMLSTNGLVAAESTEALSGAPVAHLARQVLNVDRRAAARVPVPLKAKKVDAALQTEETAPPASLDELSDSLLPPSIKQKLVEGKFHRLLILPAADIGTVPWSALPIGNEMIVDRLAVVILADIDWIVRSPQEVSTTNAIGETNTHGLIVGDPDLSADKRYKFIPLPGAREEAKEVSELWFSFNSTLLLGEAAERTQVIAQLKGFNTVRLGLIYFATHGVSDATNPMDGSFLALKGDHLYGRDIKELVLDSHPLVVMSACQTGLGKTFDAGTFGLARAWWGAGAAQVVMSLWNIDDAATRDLMVSFIDRVSLLVGIPATEKNDLLFAREEILRVAMLKMREKYKDPALWASFLLLGIPTKVDPPKSRPGN
jgi:CHAT domain-containing protein